MSPFHYRHQNIILAFLGGLVIFVLLIPGCFSSTANLSTVENPKPFQQVTLSAANSFPNSTSPLGVGLSGIADWSTELPFLDAFKSSRQWFTQCVSTDPGCQGEFDTQEAHLLNLDENGWIKSLPNPSEPPKYTRASTFLFLVGTPNLYPAGKYVVLYDGEGTIEYKFDATKKTELSTPGRDVIEVDAKGNGILLTITSTDPKKNGNYIRNIRVIQAEYEKNFKNEIFNPLFLEKIKNFKVLRFMDWMGTNGSEQQEWSRRPIPTNASYADRGNVPIEIMVALANKVKAEPWFNMPHKATDEYISKFAQLVKEQLDPNLKVYVEFSNEVWNGSFQQWHYASEQGKARWGQDKADAYMQWYGMRTAQMCDIWKSVFGSQKNRVVCVLATQRAWKGLENSALDCSYWVAEGNKPCYQHGIDVYAIAAYASGNLGSPESASQVESWLQESDGGFSKAFQQLKEGGLLGGFKDSLPDAYEDFIYHADVAKKKDLKLVAYEGGQHIIGVGEVVNNERLTNFFITINSRPEMYDFYTQLLSNWKKAGGTLFMQYVDIGGASKWGSWGALEYVSQNGSPKYNALMDFIAKNPCDWAGCANESSQK